MKCDSPDGPIRKDWLVFFGLHVAIPATLFAAGWVVTAVFRAKQGDITLLWLALASALTGITLLFVAKWPLYQQGKYMTFGPGALPTRRRKVYWVAYAFIGSGALIMLLLLASLR